MRSSWKSESSTALLGQSSLPGIWRTPGILPSYSFGEAEASSLSRRWLKSGAYREHLTASGSGLVGHYDPHRIRDLLLSTHEYLSGAAAASPGCHTGPPQGTVGERLSNQPGEDAFSIYGDVIVRKAITRRPGRDNPYRSIGREPLDESRFRPMRTNSESERRGTAGNEAFSAQIVMDDHGAVVVQVSGELDLAGAATMEEILNAACSVPAETVEVDATSLTFLDAIALGVLLGAHERLLKERSRGLTVRGAVGIVRRVFEITGFASLLDDRDRAVPRLKIGSGLSERREATVARGRSAISIEEVFVSYFSLGARLTAPRWSDTLRRATND
jgi:anti-anti-sigma factor